MTASSTTDNETRGEDVAPSKPDARDPVASDGTAPSEPAGADRAAQPPERDSDRHLRTDHLHDDLKGRSVRGGMISFVTSGGTFLIRLTETVVLARLLTPEAFGLVAMVAAFNGFLLMFQSAGLPMATVQRDGLTHQQVSNLFWINLGLSIAIGALFAAAAPALAWMYGEPRLVPITFALAGTFVFAGLSVQHGALLQRQMRFDAQALAELVPMGVGVVAAIVAAWLGAGYWALVLLVGLRTIVRAPLVWLLCPWRPGLLRRGAGARSLVLFGMNLTGANLLRAARDNAPRVALGIAAGATSLGLFSRAMYVLSAVGTLLKGAIGKVGRPGLSRLQNEPERYRRYYRRGIESLFLIGALPIGFAAVYPEAVVTMILGSQWDAAAPIMQALTPAALAILLQPSAGWLYISWGHTDRQLRASAVCLAVVIGAVCAGLPWGGLGVAVGFGASMLATAIGAMLYAQAETPVRPRDVLQACWRPLLAAGGLGAIGLALPSPGSIPQTLAAGAAATLAYGLALLALPGSVPLQYAGDAWRALKPAVAPIRPAGEQRGEGNIR